jgi:hypothetical protein
LRTILQRFSVHAKSNENSRRLAKLMHDCLLEHWGQFELRLIGTKAVVGRQDKHDAGHWHGLRLSKS